MEWDKQPCEDLETGNFDNVSHLLLCASDKIISLRKQAKQADKETAQAIYREIVEIFAFLPEILDEYEKSKHSVPLQLKEVAKSHNLYAQEILDSKMSFCDVTIDDLLSIDNGNDGLEEKNWLEYFAHKYQ